VYKEYVCPGKEKDKSHSNKYVREKAKSIVRQLQRIRFGLRVIIYEGLSGRN
jgi:hypothetical protein